MIWWGIVVQSGSAWYYHSNICRMAKVEFDLILINLFFGVCDGKFVHKYGRDNTE